MSHIKDSWPCDGCEKFEECLVSGLECRAFREWVHEKKVDLGMRGIGLQVVVCVECSDREIDCENWCSKIKGEL